MRARVREWSVEMGIEQRAEWGSHRMHMYADGTYRVSVTFDCDADFVEAFQRWIREQQVEGSASMLVPKSRRLASAQPRLPAAPVEGELLDDEPDE